MALDLRGVTTLLQVYDMPASVRFYRDLLGFEIVSHSPHRGGDPDRFHWCLLRLGGAEVMLNSAYEFDEERPVTPDPARVAAHGDTGLFIGCPDVDAT
jgi:glyoxylase I family protein